MLNYAEANALAEALAKYILLCFFSPVAFIIGFRLIISYFKSVVEDQDVDVTLDVEV